jgi:hypothetical protein
MLSVTGRRIGENFTGKDALTYTLLNIAEYRIYPIANPATFLHIEAILKAALNNCQVQFSPSFGAEAVFIHDAAENENSPCACGSEGHESQPIPHKIVRNP